MSTGRREFLKQLIGAAIAQKLPIGLVEGKPQLVELEAAKIIYKQQPYALGFTVSRELIEDDLYWRELEEAAQSLVYDTQQKEIEKLNPYIGDMIG